MSIVLISLDLSVGSAELCLKLGVFCVLEVPEAQSSSMESKVVEKTHFPSTMPDKLVNNGPHHLIFVFFVRFIVIGGSSTRMP